MKAYLFYYRKEPILLYGYTTDKTIARKFQEMRDPELFTMVTKKFSKTDLEEGFDDPVLERILGKKRGTYEKRLEIMMNPFTDGEQDFMIPSTVLELLTVDGHISTVEELAMENFREINKVLFKEDFKEFLIECNKLSMYDERTDEVVNIVDAFQIFIKEYGHLLRKEK